MEEIMNNMETMTEVGPEELNVEINKGKYAIVLLKYFGLGIVTTLGCCVGAYGAESGVKFLEKKKREKEAIKRAKEEAEKEETAE